ncbi:DUF6538 domain-containing protein [Celeribacter sp. ULVN23_4]
MAFAMPHPVLRNNKWYLDVRIPADVLAAYRKYKGMKGERVRKSLETGDAAEAKKRFAEEYSALLNTFARLRSEEAGNTVRLTNKQVTALAGVHYQDLMKRFEDDPPEVAETRETLKALGSIRHLRGSRGKWFRRVMDDLLSEEGLAVDEDSYIRLGEAFYDAALQAIEAFERFAEGDYSPDPKANRFPAWSAPDASQVVTPSVPVEVSSGVTIDSLFDRWEKNHRADGKTEETIEDRRAKVQSFKDFIGHGDAERVTPKDVGNWVDFLKFEKRLSAKTVSGGYLTALSAIYRLARSRGEKIANPAAEVTVKVPPKKKLREQGFTDAEAAQILKAARCDPATLGRRTPYNKSAIRWVPWLCAYSGARVTEIAQLHKEDFLEKAGGLAIHISIEDGRSVKSGEYRVVPVHPHLLEIGLDRFIQDCADGPLFFPDPPDAKLRKSKARNAGNKVREWVRDIVGIDDPNIQPNHGWRHRFTTLAGRADIGERYLFAIQGHSDGRSSFNYGDVEVETMRREIEKIPRQVDL